MRLQEGMNAPDFELTDGEGKMHRMSDCRGSTVVLYFYPKDDTPGCTIEACEFRDKYAAAQKKGIVLLGVSPDDAKAHQKFAKKFSLPFPLLSDPDHAVATKYGAWGKKKFMGREYDGIIRSTFVIDGNGIVVRAIYEVKPLGHAADVLGKI